MSEAAESKTFSELGVRDSVVEVLGKLGYERPTPVQERTIPLLLSGRDVIGQAQTGTGKTAAFSLPLLEKVDSSSSATQALVLAPTRELAMQVADALHSYAAGLGHISVLPVYGGAPIVPQLKRLERGAQVVVGTPGRIIDHLDRGSLDLSNLKFLVLDEADEMLKMGFIEDVERILSAMPESRQIALFSATMPKEVLDIARKHLRNAERIEVEHKTMTAPAIEQRFLNVSEGQKLDVLTQILEIEQNDAVLIFRRTKNGAAELAEKLEGRGFAAVAMHGDMQQSLRESVIRRLRAGQIDIVVATDVAARGIDVEQITHVINYDIPHDVEAYVHRIGRTGRAGRTGIATLFITPRERRMMREIERYTGSVIKPMKMPTQADVAAHRITQLKDAIRKNMNEGDLELYLSVIEQLAEEGEHDMAEIAAAAARLAAAERPIATPAPQRQEREPVVRESYAAPSRPQQSFGSAPAHRPPAPRDRAASDASRPGAEGPDRVRLMMEVGRADGIRPADIVGSIANEADVQGRDIGPIDILETATFVYVPASASQRIIEKVGRARFRGRAVNLRVATDQDYVDSLASEGPRPQRDDRPRGPRFGSEARRPSGDRPGFNRDRGDRPSFNRDRGDRPSFNRGDRPSYNRPDRPQGDRPSYNRPDRPAGDRPSYNRPDRGPSDRPKFGDRARGGNDRFGGGPARPSRFGSSSGPSRGPRDRDDRGPRPPKPFGRGSFRPGSGGPKKR